ncbi:MAG: Hsp20 family protein, partial [Desulfobulbaceae bacterium]|nr:Hsp20 family protein [Desulfobulbaceae bacterium]
MALIQFTERPHFRNPWTEFERIRQGLDELSRGIDEGGKPTNQATVYPALNVAEDADHLIIRAELHAVKAEDLEITHEGETLPLQGKRKARDDAKLSYHRREIKHGSFSRAITLPTKVDSEHMTAKLTNGILTLTLGKASEVKPRKITVTTSRNGEEAH